MPSIIQPSVIRRLLMIIVLADRSGSMGGAGKIAALNYCGAELADAIKDFAKETPQVDVRVQVISFGGNTATKMFGAAVAAGEFRWTDLTAAGGTPLGAGIDCAADELGHISKTAPRVPSVVALASDGKPGDDWQSALGRYMATPLGKESIRTAIAVGEDADRAMLAEFSAGCELGVLEASNPAQLLSAIMLATVRASEVASRTPAGQNQSQMFSQQSISVSDLPEGTLTRSLIDDPDVENARW